MSKLGLTLSLYLLFTSCKIVSASYSSSSSSIYARDGNSTTFTFAIPSSSHDPNFSDWVTVVCLDPGSMTKHEGNMPGFVRCPNTDVSGILVRVSAYLANLLLWIVIMYDPKKASDGVWAQLLTVYSLLISAVVAIYTTGLTRFHASMALLLVLSPLSFALGVYAILGFLGRPHRLDSILSSRREHFVPRLAVIAFWLFAIAAVLLMSLSSETHFTAPPPCDPVQTGDGVAVVAYGMTFIPYVGAAFIILAMYERGEIESSTTVLGIVSISLFLVVTALVVAVIKSQGSLTAQVRLLNLNTRSNRFWAYWFVPFTETYQIHSIKTVSGDYLEHATRFYTFAVFLIPIIHWVTINEICLFGTADNIFSITFGQVLAVFVVLQPLFQVLMMLPRAAGWFIILSPIRLITGRQKEFVPMPLDMQEGDLEMVSLKSWEKLEGYSSL
ncbi:hypothetical protein MSAN_00529100 [Mycena sanguinolenta]|uniref:Uncharacterized protein n=1 Tax=Mycena sanguinolenta TaxID=230812 RepID=A0A8H6ZCK5_9AGAR|nr:hypothetical protein MSAN_00529100 [Mycena sanguinolenta]